MTRKIVAAALLGLALCGAAACGQPAITTTPQVAPPAVSRATFCAGLQKMVDDFKRAGLENLKMDDATLDENMRKVLAIAPPDIAADVVVVTESMRRSLRGEQATPEQSTAVAGAMDRYLEAVKSCQPQ